MWWLKPQIVSTIGASHPDFIHWTLANVEDLTKRPPSPIMSFLEFNHYSICNLSWIWKVRRKICFFFSLCNKFQLRSVGWSIFFLWACHQKPGLKKVGDKGGARKWGKPLAPDPTCNLGPALQARNCLKSSEDNEEDSSTRLKYETKESFSQARRWLKSSQQVNGSKYWHNINETKSAKHTKSMVSFFRIVWFSHQWDSRVSRFFSFSLLVLDLEPFQFHFHFSKKSEGILFFTFHFSKKVKAIGISLFFLEKKEWN